MTITMTFTDAEHALLTTQATAARFRSVSAWAKTTLLEIAKSHEALRELDRKKAELKRSAK